MTGQIASRSTTAVVSALLIGMAGLSNAQPAHSTQAGAGVCPAPTPITGRVAMKPLQAKRLTWFRRQYHLNGMGHKELKVLSAPKDASVCHDLDQIFNHGYFGLPSTVRTYYRVHGYYFASFADSRPLSEPGVPTPRLFVLDSKLRVFATIAPRLDL